jgi:hypothetical protein
MTALDKLAPHDDEGARRVVIEVQRGLRSVVYDFVAALVAENAARLDGSVEG